MKLTIVEKWLVNDSIFTSLEDVKKIEENNNPSKVWLVLDETNAKKMVEGETCKYPVYYNEECAVNAYDNPW